MRTPAGLEAGAVAGDAVFGDWRDELGVESLGGYRLRPPSDAP